MQVNIKLWGSDCCNYCPLMQEKIKKGKKFLFCNFFKEKIEADSRGRIKRLEKCLKENGFD